MLGYEIKVIHGSQNGKKIEYHNGTGLSIVTIENGGSQGKLIIDAMCIVCIILI